MFIYGPTNAGRVRRHSTRQNENVAQMRAPPPHPCRPTETVALLCVALFLLPAVAVPASAWDKLMSKVLPRRQFTSAQARHNVGSLFNGARSVARVHLHHRLAELLESDFWVVHAHEAHEVTIHAQDDHKRLRARSWSGLQMHHLGAHQGRRGCMLVGPSPPRG